MAAWHAARMMVPAKQGLIINVSSIGGLTYLFNVAYGIGKAAVRATYYRLQNEIEVCVWFFFVWLCVGIHEMSLA